MFYPYPDAWPALEVAGAGLLLGGVTLLAVWWLRRRPYLAVGWFWFLGTLVPMIGLVQVSHHAMADRYSYVPLIGAFVAIAWGVLELLAQVPGRPVWLAAGATALVIICAAAAHRQVSHWENSVTLNQHALAVTGNNFMAHENLGAAFDHQGRFDEALTQFELAFKTESARRFNPDLPCIRYDLGTALARKGRFEEAKRHLLRALEMQPNLARIHHNLGSLLVLEGNLDQAIAHYQQALRLRPDYAVVRSDLATVQAQRQRWVEATSHYNAGAALLKKERTREAIDEFKQALNLRPDWPGVLNNLAWLLATHPNAEFRKGAEAVPLAERACQLTGATNLAMVATLAAAYAEAGEFHEAVSTQQKACELAAAQGQKAEAETFHRRLELYSSGHAYHRP
jgi:protein O-mannosyl-transferase